MRPARIRYDAAEDGPALDLLWERYDDRVVRMGRRLVPGLVGPASVIVGLVLGQDYLQVRSPKISIRSVHSVRAVRTQRSAYALPAIVNYTRSARSVSTRAGDAPVHPLCRQDFEFVAHRQSWGEDQVHLRDRTGELFSLPARVD